MDSRRLRGELRALGLPARFTVVELAEALAVRRSKPLRLRPESLPADGLTGGLLITDTIDFIAYQRDTSKVHQDHIICHEFGHLIAGHRTVKVDGLEAIRLLAPHIDPAVIRRMLGRSCFQQRDEQEAEAMAGMLMEQHITRWTAPEEWFAPLYARRLLDTLGPGET
jgi:IrrE N-terminal-like domain